MEQNIYRLSNGLKPISWQLPLKGLKLEKIVEEYNKETREVEKVSKGKRRVKYVDGANSIFEEDLKGDYVARQIWFEYGELQVDADDDLLNYILQHHPLFNRVFYLFNEQEEIKKELKEYKVRDNVRELIANSEADKIQAVAIAVLGLMATEWDSDKAEIELRKYADEKPLELETALNSKSYESKYLSALAFSKGIVKNNVGQTAVIWNDTTQGTITTIAKGENGITKLSEFLSESTDESLLVWQTIGEKVDKLTLKIPKKDKDVIAEIERKNATIEALKKQLKSLKEGTTKKSEIEILQEQYKDKFGKDVANAYKTNKEWLQSKLAE